jgi:hypothetical protein
MNRKRLAIFAAVAVAVLVIAAGAFALLRESDGDDGFAMPASAASRQDLERKVESESIQASAPRAAAGAPEPAPSGMFEESAEFDAIVPASMEAPSVAMDSAGFAPMEVKPELIEENTAPTDRKIIRNASLNLIVEDPEHAIARIQQIVAGVSGAYISNSDIRDPESGLPTTLTLRIPSEEFDAVIDETKSLAAEILRDTVNSRDVTEEYADIDSQLRNLKATEEQYLLILTQAEDVEDVLAVQDRLRSVRGEIEVLQGRINLLDNQIGLSTLTVVLHAPPDLSIQIAADSVPYANSSQMFVITYGNEGSIEARDVTAVLTVPERMGFDWADYDGSFDPVTRTVTWDLFDLSPGNRGVFTVSLSIESSDEPLEPTIRISTLTTETSLLDNTGSTRFTFFSDLQVQIETPSAIAHGEDATIFLNYLNSGTGHVDEVVLTAVVPAGMEFVSTGDGGAYDEQSRAITWSLQRLEARESGNRWADLRMELSEGDLQIQASIAGSETDNDPFDNADQAFLSALAENLSERTVWDPGGTVGDSLDALGSFARNAVDASIWVVTFGVPLLVLVVIVYGVRRFRRRKH